MASLAGYQPPAFTIALSNAGALSVVRFGLRGITANIPSGHCVHIFSLASLPPAAKIMAGVSSESADMLTICLVNVRMKKVDP